MDSERRERDMKKKAIALMLVAAMAIGTLAGCGNKKVLLEAQMLAEMDRLK